MSFGSLRLLVTRVAVSSIFAFCFNSTELKAECFSQSRRPQRDPLPQDLTNVDLSSLLNFDLEVTSPSKKAQQYSKVTSAIYVLTGEEIVRSGATNVAEALRLVPGLQVARTNANRWAISARGFNRDFADKLLVLVDGQSVFISGFNGVQWDLQEVALEDVDRIEVIRGPGAAIWGYNAVNGVINIITCKSQDTQGWILGAGGGNEHQLIDNVRYGGKLSPNTNFRIFNRTTREEDSKLKSGQNAEDGAWITNTGIRVDSEPTKEDKLVFKAEGFYSEKDYPVSVPSLDPPYNDTDSFSGEKASHGFHSVVNWKHELEKDSNLNLQLDHSFEHEGGEVFAQDRNTFHLESSHRLKVADSHEVQYGAEYQYYSDDIEGNFADSFDPSERTTHVFTAMVQDEITLIQDKLNLVVGSKLGDNSYTDFEYMPNIRIGYYPSDKQTVWAAASKALALPSRVQNDVIIPVAAIPGIAPGITGLAVLNGNRGLQPEQLYAYEAGYRAELRENLSFDLAVFYHDYDNLFNGEPEQPYFGAIDGQSRPTLIVPLRFQNSLEAESYGVEVSAEWQAETWWRLTGWYSLLKLHVFQNGSTSTASKELYEGGNPTHQAQLRSTIALSDQLDFSQVVRYVSSLDWGNVDSYTELDLRLGWMARKDLELALVGRNLLDSEHQEFSGAVLPPPASEVERSVYASVTWWFDS